MFSLISFVVFPQEEIQKYQRARIYYHSPDDLKRLDALGIPLDHGIKRKDHSIESVYSASELEKVRDGGFQMDILIEDAEAHFLSQNRNLQRPANTSCDHASIEYTTPSNFIQGSMGGYLTYQELLDQLDLMKTLYPSLISTKQNISTFLTEGTPDNSVTPPIGGNGIKWVRISDNPEIKQNKPEVLYTALHHAREPMSLSQLVFYMWYLLENYDTNPEIQGIINNTELYFVPVINPDGYLYNQKTNPNGGGYWRKNRNNTHGTDINRNYDYYIDGDPNNAVWGGQGTSPDTNSEIYAGTGPFSEIETQAIKYFVENHDFKVALNNHSFGNLLLYPYGYESNTPTPDNDLFLGFSTEMVSQNNYNNILSSELYPTSGSSDDFMYGTVGNHNKIFAQTPEIGGDFWPPSSYIIPTSKSMMYMNLTAAKIVNNHAVIEDQAPLYLGSDTNVVQNFSLKRIGISGSGNFTVSLIPISNNIISVGNPIEFVSLDLLEEQSSSIDYTLTANTQPGEDVLFEIIVNNGSYDSATLISKKFGSPTQIFSDPGDSVSDNFNNDGWGTTTATYFSPSSSITDSPDGLYENYQTKTITLKHAIDLTQASGASVSFYAKWAIEKDYDFVQFQVSTDGGATWAAQCGKYTNPGTGYVSQPLGQPLYDGDQLDWVQESINLNDYLGENIRIRFLFRSDNMNVSDGFYFDDLTLYGIDGTLDVNENEPFSFTIYPNPVKNIQNIKTQLQNYSIELFNLQGQPIKSLKHFNGTQSINFEGIVSGIYILKLNSETTSQTFKIIKE